jgi:molecular chaperone GrpE
MEEQQKDQQANILTDESLVTEQATDQSPSEGTSPDKEEKVIAKLQEEVAEWKDKHLRLYADFENLRKRATKERLELIKSAGEEVIASLLPVVDDLERAVHSLDHSKESAALEGIQLIQSKLLKILEQKGLKAMKSVGEPFDAELHEAITEIPVPEEEQKGKVADEVEKGYYLHDKVIRYAKVVVGK